MKSVITTTITIITILTTVQLPTLADIHSNTEVWNPPGQKAPKDSKGSSSR